MFRGLLRRLVRAPALPVFCTVQLHETAAAVVAPHLHVCENVVRLRPVPNANSGVPW